MLDPEKGWSVRPEQSEELSEYDLAEMIEFELRWNKREMTMIATNEGGTQRVEKSRPMRMPPRTLWMCMRRGRGILSKLQLADSAR